MLRRDRLRGTLHLLRKSLGALAVAATCSVFTPALAQQAPADEAETQSAATSSSEDVEEIVAVAGREAGRQDGAGTRDEARGRTHGRDRIAVHDPIGRDSDWL